MTEEDPDEKEIERSTHPGLDLRPAWTKDKGVVTITELRPRLARCREIFMMVSLPPDGNVTAIILLLLLFLV